mmetsp:Transcript_37629/g.80315  ORF Transcript_37629/g.80315 Transcript_37629/m.80315 type:complete len:244 (-) Transcript_37629:64-795(-)
MSPTTLTHSQIGEAFFEPVLGLRRHRTAPQVDLEDRRAQPLHADREGFLSLRQGRPQSLPLARNVNLGPLLEPVAPHHVQDELRKLRRLLLPDLVDQRLPQRLRYVRGRHPPSEPQKQRSGLLALAEIFRQIRSGRVAGVLLLQRLDQFGIGVYPQRVDLEPPLGSGAAPYQQLLRPGRLDFAGERDAVYDPLARRGGGGVGRRFEEIPPEHGKEDGRDGDQQGDHEFAVGEGHAARPEDWTA